MGQKSDLTKTEKARIVSMLANEVSTLQIAKQLNRCHRTIKKFIENSQHTRSRSDKKVMRSVTKKQLTLLKKSLAQNQLATSRALFNEANIPVPSRTTRCKTLRIIAKLRKPIKQPPLSKRHKDDRVKWAMSNLKTNFTKVIFTDECRATLDGPDGMSRGWLMNKSASPMRLR